MVIICSKEKLMMWISWNSMVVECVREGLKEDVMSEDRRHPRMVEIYSISKVDETMLLIKEAGYLRI